MRILEIEEDLNKNQYSWLITGVAGFIGSNLLEYLLKYNQKVVGLDNISTGKLENIDDVKLNVSEDQWSNFTFYEGDICNIDDCKKALEDIDFVLHQAALGSVPRSIKDPIKTNNSNISGFLNMIFASKEHKVKSFVYAASSSTYGDHKDLPKVEEKIGTPLSPYAITKFVNELYADVFFKIYNFNSIGLRYFNVFGKRQDPNGAYAAVIPKWINSMIKNNEININGDGKTSRDFCYIENAIQANLLATFAEEDAKNQVYNVAVGDQTSLNQLYEIIKKNLIGNNIDVKNDPVYKDFRDGDVRHSKADITKAKDKLGYLPKYKIAKGIEESLSWYINKLNN
tara:strand:+ start:32 stop:1054 length:1023 start_codon:yes stop_codon:yes gene_type:complete